jgi:mannose-6-phosphate isomerase
MPLYALKFRPRMVEKIWGGRNIQTILGKALPPAKLIGESWEIYDLPPGVVDDSGQWASVTIDNGPLAGQTLRQIIEDCADDLMGDVPLAGQGQFPLLVKYLDAGQDLSLQVHPDERYVASHPGCYLKNEAWYIVHNEPGALIYKGLVAGTTQTQLEAAIADGTAMDYIKRIAVKPGQCHYLPSGTLHSMGKGVLAAEVQTPSDSTFRVFDFNRIDESTGKPRNLHIRQALDCIDFSGQPEPPQRRSHVAGLFTTVTQLVDSPYFKIEKVRFTEGVEEAIPYDEPVIWMMLQGQAQVKVDDVSEPTACNKGDTILLPAAMKNPVIKTLSDCVWLEVTFPKMTR